MEVTGTVTSVRRMRTDHGSMFIRAVIAREGAHDIALTWLHGIGQPVPARGQRVTITGMPIMMTRPRKGSYRTNISVFTLTIHDQEDPS